MAAQTEREFKSYRDCPWKRELYGYNGSCNVCFVCPKCGAMTTDPVKHRDWHLPYSPISPTT